MDRYEKARDYHKRGFNCCQSVLASFTDLTGMSEQECFDIAGGFGAGAGTGELCGAITGAAMTLGRLTPVDPADPVGSKKRTVALSTCWATSMTRRPPSVSTVSASRMPGSSPAGNVTSTTGPET